MKLTTLTASRALAYLHCPRKYYYSYTLALPRSTNYRAHLGSCFHETMKANFRQKMETGKDVIIPDLQEYFSAEFEDGDVNWYGADKGKEKDTGIAIVANYMEHIAPDIFPTAVEESFVMKFANYSWTYQGKIDLIDRNVSLIDLKTSKQRVNKPKKDHVIQVGGYLAAYRRKLGNPGLRGRLDYVVKNKNLDVMIHYIDDAEEHERFFLNMLAQVAAGIEAEIFPANRTDMYCPCEYAEDCQNDCGGVIAA